MNCPGVKKSLWDAVTFDAYVIAWEAIKVFNECSKAGASLEECFFAAGVHILFSICDVRVRDYAIQILSDLTYGLALDIMSTEVKLTVINNQTTPDTNFSIDPNQTTNQSSSSHRRAIVGPYERGPLNHGQKPSYLGYGWSYIGKLHGKNDHIPIVNNLGRSY